MSKTRKAAVPISIKRPAIQHLSVAILLPVLGLLLTYYGLRANSPTLYDSNASASGQSLTVTITNKGRTAQIGKGWCGAGAFLTPGLPQITRFVTGVAPDLLRRSSMAPDEQDTLDMPIPVSINPALFKEPALAGSVNPLWARVNPATIWIVACTIPYSDGLGKWLKSDTLKFCYEIQPTGQGIERKAVMCVPDSVDNTVRALGGQLPGNT
jgi:hypothetical protein